MTIDITSGVSARTGRAFVILRWGAESGQLTPEEARQHGLRIIACAQAAEDDAAFFAGLVDTGLDAQVGFAFLGNMREHRAGGEAAASQAFSDAIAALDPADFPHGEAPLSQRDERRQRMRDARGGAR